MKPIIQLDQSLVNKIAAGEVVERPLSVVKELTENAIDAGATIITVEIADGGLEMVRVTDNGGGIAAEELPLAFSRHATSKITNLDDLFQVETLGFRGEALSSIAAVAQVEMITKTANAVSGTKVEIHGGKILSRQNVGCANGTTIVVANLFYNTPARRKFLKKPATEAAYISDCLQRLALGNPRLTLRYINNGKIVFQSTGNGDLKTVMLNIYGREAATKTINVDANVGDIHLYGLVGKPELARGNRQHGTFIINGRYIQSKLLSNAIESAMRTMLPAGKFPLYVLNLNLPFNWLDVNVHPTKMDVRFADEEFIFNTVENVVKNTLSEHNLIPTRKAERVRVTAQPETEQLPLEQVVQPKAIAPTYTHNDSDIVRNDRTRLPEDFISATEFSKSSKPANNIDKVLSEYFKSTKAVSARERSDNLSKGVLGQDGERSHPLTVLLQDGERSPSRTVLLQDGDDIIGQDDVNVQSNTTNVTKCKTESPLCDSKIKSNLPADKKSQLFTSYQVVGLIFNTYWLVTQNESLYLIDQHAAHERVLYENLLSKARKNTAPSQQLLIPIPLHLTPGEKQTLSDNIEYFQNIGFGIQVTDDNFAIDSVPFLINSIFKPVFFTDLLDKIGQHNFSANNVYSGITELIAMSACKAAVKSGDGLSEPEARAMITQLMELDNPFTCPHGRPTIIEITQKELKRRFKRS